MGGTNIYVLKLRNNKYYVGKTKNLINRMDDHVSGNGSAWTRKYKPISIEEFKKDCDDFDEDKYTKIYMGRHGIENVRGGSYTKIVLDDETLRHLSQELKTSEDRCFNCNKLGHFANCCPQKEDEDEGEIDVSNIYINRKKYLIDSDNILYDYNTHEALGEYDRKKKIIYELDDNDNDDDNDDDDDDDNDDDADEENHVVVCNGYNNRGNNINKCFRCGRSGHYSSSCYASRHQRGYKLY